MPGKTSMAPAPRPSTKRPASELELELEDHILAAPPEKAKSLAEQYEALKARESNRPIQRPPSHPRTKPPEPSAFYSQELLDLVDLARRTVGTPFGQFNRVQADEADEAADTGDTGGF